MSVKIRNIVKKLMKALPDLDEDIDVCLLCLVQRDEGFGKWDVVVASHQLNEGTIESYNIISNLLFDKMEPEENMEISRIVIMDSDDKNTKMMMQELPLYSCVSGSMESPKDFGVSIIEDELGFEIRKIFLLRNLKMGCENEEVD